MCKDIGGIKVHHLIRNTQYLERITIDSMLNNWFYVNFKKVYMLSTCKFAFSSNK